MTGFFIIVGWWSSSSRWRFRGFGPLGTNPMLAAFLLALAVICGFGAATLLLLENSAKHWSKSCSATTKTN